MTKIWIFFMRLKMEIGAKHLYVTDALPVVMQPLMNSIYLYHVIISFVSFPHNSIGFCVAGTEGEAMKLDFLGC